MKTSVLEWAVWIIRKTGCDRLWLQVRIPGKHRRFYVTTEWSIFINEWCWPWECAQIWKRPRWLGCVHNSMAYLKKWLRSYVIYSEIQRLYHAKTLNDHKYRWFLRVPEFEWLNVVCRKDCLHHIYEPFLSLTIHIMYVLLYTNSW